MKCTSTTPWNRRQGSIPHPDAIYTGFSWRCSHCGLLTETKPYRATQKLTLPCAKCDSNAGWGGDEINLSLGCSNYCWRAVHFVEDEAAENEPQREALLNFWNELQLTYPKFKELKALWKEETMFSSSSSFMAANPNYQEIISLGDVAVALILDDFRTHGADHWFMALAELTGVNPIPKEHAGRVNEMMLDWVNWAEERTHEYDKPTISFTT